MSPTTLAAALSAGLLLSISGCVPQEQDPLTCTDNGSCAHQDEKTFCDIDGVHTDSGFLNECVVPPSADACNRIEECADSGKHCSDDSDGTCVDCTENAHCSVDGESCNTNTGECGDFTPCTVGEAGDAECEANTDGNDYCSAGGICAACIVDDHCTTAAAAICDETSFECRSCEVGSDDCESGLCGTRDEGECVPEDAVIYMDASAVGGGGCGDTGAPCKTFAEALPLVTASRNVISVAAGTYDSNDGDVNRVELSSGSATIVANGEVIVAPLLAGGQNAVTATAGAELHIIGVDIAPTSAVDTTDAVFCSSATLSIRAGSVTGADDIGIIGDSCDLTVTGSTISGNRGGGISVSGGDFNIVNNFIVDNVSTGTIGGAKFEATSGTEILNFNTFARNRRSGVAGYSLICDATTLTARNNIFMLAEASTAGLITECVTEFSLIDSDSSTTAAGSNIAGEASFVAVDTGDYHLNSKSDGINEADPAATLATDIDGEERPQGGRHDIGADEAE